MLALHLSSYLAGITAAIITLIRVVFLAIDAAIFNDEVKGVVHKTAIATLVVLLITVHEFLL